TSRHQSSGRDARAPNPQRARRPRSQPRSGRDGRWLLTNSAHKLEGAAPARLRDKMDDQVHSLRQSVRERRTRILALRRLKRPVDQERAAGDQLSRHEAPKPAVPATLTVVSHDEVLAGRRDQITVSVDVLRNLR